MLPVIWEGTIFNGPGLQAMPLDSLSEEYCQKFETLSKKS